MLSTILERNAIVNKEQIKMTKRKLFLSTIITAVLAAPVPVRGTASPSGLRAANSTNNIQDTNSHLDSIDPIKYRQLNRKKGQQSSGRSDGE